MRKNVDQNNCEYGHFSRSDEGEFCNLLNSLIFSEIVWSEISLFLHIRRLLFCSTFWPEFF